MPRILGIDYGNKRVGLAVTDPLKIIASPLDTIHAKDIVAYLKNYCLREEVEKIIVGEAKTLRNENTHSSESISNFVKHLKKTFPTISIEMIDERFTSKIAMRSMVDMGLKKKDRQKKENLDKISASLILQTYLDKTAI